MDRNQPACEAEGRLVAGTLVVRADASPDIGGGHLMRCLALASEWGARGGKALFISRCENQSLRDRIAAAGAEIASVDTPHPHPGDLEITQSTIERVVNAGKPCDRTWLVLDGYHFDPDYQVAVRCNGCSTMVIDDTAHLPFYTADIIFNQNINADQLEYHCPQRTKLLLGPDYCLLRPEFLAWRAWQRDVPPKAARILVTLGAGNPHNVTSDVLSALMNLNDTSLKVKVVVGPLATHIESLKDQVASTNSEIELLTDVTNMPSLMAWADIAVAAAGSTCWEFAFLGLPAILVIVAENQRKIAQGLDQAGIAVNLGAPRAMTHGDLQRALIDLIDRPDKRAEMTRSGRKMVDGFGVDRVISRMCRR